MHRYLNDKRTFYSPYCFKNMTQIYNFFLLNVDESIVRRCFDNMGTKWSKYDKLWVVFSIMLILFGSIYKFLFIVNSNSNIVLEVISCLLAICGVTYVFGIAKQSKFAYFFGIANVILYAIVCYSKELYLSMSYNLFYSFPVLIYGYINWSKETNGGNIEIKSLSRLGRIILGFGMIIAVCIFALISKNIFYGSNVLLDSIVSVSICVATFLMANKYIEQWVLFIIANFFGLVMFLVINFSNMNDVELLIMWTIYLINSFYGMFAWRKTLKKDN